MDQAFENREQAGRLLAEHLKEKAKKDLQDAILLALPRGGVPIAFEISKALKLPFDVLIVRKIGHPFHPEYGIGAMAEDGLHWIDPDAVGLAEISETQLSSVIALEKKEIDRRIEKYRNGRPLPPLEGKTVIVVDDGLATGVTARMGARYLKASGAKKVILAVPVCSERAAKSLLSDVDEIVCLRRPPNFRGVGQFYRDFSQTTDQEVLDLLAQRATDPRRDSLREVEIPNENGVKTHGFLNLPAGPKGLVIFAHGSGSGRFSSRNQQVASVLNGAGIGTLLFDLLTEKESKDRKNVFDIPLLASRLVSAVSWARAQDFGKEIPLGFFGASTGGGAALWAAADLKSEIQSVVSRGGRPDLALPRLPEVSAPTLLLVGDLDTPVIALNEKALARLKNARLTLIPGATHLFEEPGTLELVSKEAADWFLKSFTKKPFARSVPPPSAEKILADHAHPVQSGRDLAPVIEKLSSSRIVMLGESSHGTQEFYEWRRLISQELIENHGFNFIVVEGDWPPCAEMNRFVHGESDWSSAREMLKSFQRWPTWMWANTEIARLADWMKNYNRGRDTETGASFYGLDVYSLFESMNEVIQQVRQVDPALAERVQAHYACFDPFERDERAYARSLHFIPAGCEEQALEALQDLLRVRLEKTGRDFDRVFDAQQNARIVKNAEQYYRVMILGDEDSWNVRDRHMMETLNILMKRHGPESKGIVWAHNTHIGDYRATSMVQEGQVNIGGLAREEWGDDRVALLGFGTYEGSVIASHAWDGPTQIMPVPQGRSKSYEELFHKASSELGADAFFVWLKDELKESALSEIRGHRAIGVVYNPAFERGNYVPTSLSHRYDGFFFVDRTKALAPLMQKFVRGEIPETWPRGV